MQPISIDEAFLDVTDAVHKGKFPLGIALDIKKRTKVEIGLDISVGVGTSKTVAKIASDLDKPDGLVLIPPGEEPGFLAPLPVDKLWGIGPKTKERLERVNIKTIGDIASKSDRELSIIFGKNWEDYRSAALGVDHSPVVVDRAPAKSLGEETTFPEDIGTGPELKEALRSLSMSVADDLRKNEIQGRTVTIKLKLADFTVLSRQKTSESPVHSAKSIFDLGWPLLLREIDPRRKFRLIGVRVSGLEPAEGRS